MRCTSFTSLFCCALFVSSVTAMSAQTPAGDKDAAAGAVLFHDTGCAHCHGTDLAGTKKGPSLIGIQNDKKWPPEKIRDQILNGGEKMPPFADSLSDDEIAQVIAFLRSRTPSNDSVASSGARK